MVLIYALSNEIYWFIGRNYNEIKSVQYTIFLLFPKWFNLAMDKIIQLHVHKRITEMMLHFIECNKNQVAQYCSLKLKVR